MPGTSDRPLFALAACLALTACQSFVPSGTNGVCITGALAPGQVFVGPITCGNMQLPGGEGRGTDTWIGNGWFRGVIRSQDSSLTVAGIGGGTLIDAAPWGQPDAVQEVIPLVGGGWLNVHSLTTTAQSVVVEGTVVPFPGSDAPGAGTDRTVTWSLDTTSPWLTVQGADGLWIHPMGGDVLDGQVVDGATTIAHDGGPVDDLGGVIVVPGATKLLVIGSDQAPSYWASDPMEIAGTTHGASAIEVLRGGVVVGRLPLSTADFDFKVQGDVDGVRAVAGGRAPGPIVAPGTNLSLTPGGQGRIDLDFTWDGVWPRPVRIDWTDDAGRSGTEVVGPLQPALHLGAGTYEMAVSAGPDVVPYATKVVVAPGATEVLRAPLQARFDPGRRVLAALDWYGALSTTWRGTDLDALRTAAADGLGYVVVAPDDDVANASGRPFPQTWLRWRNGARLLSPAGWSITAWPWGTTVRRAGHGAVDISSLSPEEALAAAWGGPGTDRFLLVDQAWLEAAGPPWTVQPTPDFVQLSAPGSDGPVVAWQAWFSWLDAAIPLEPVGPRAWVTVDNPRAFAGVDVEQGLTHGWTVATTGGLVDLRVANTPPGNVVPPPRWQPGDPIRPAGKPRQVTWPVHLHVASAGTPLTHAALIVDGTVVQAWSPADGTLQVDTTVQSGGRWAIAAAWSVDGEAWAVTAPVWLSTPQGGP